MSVQTEQRIIESRPARKEAHHRVLIIGGGTAGITVASRLRRRGITGIALIEPSETHYYQPLWTLVGAGICCAEASARPESAYIPRGVEWIRDWATEIDPDNGIVCTRSGRTYGYDYLVVAPGIQLDWHKVKGLKETLGRNWVSSNYTYETAPKTWEMLDQFRGGTAVFTMPNTPVKCGGAPQKIMYLAADLFRRRGIHKNTKILFFSGSNTLFAVPEVRAVLERVVARYGIEVHLNYNLVAVDPIRKVATFEATANHPEVQAHPDLPSPRIEVQYDFLHATPPQSAPDFIKQSPLSDGTPLGWVSVDKGTLQHTRYPNIFAIGDASNLPTSKTGAAIRKQAPILVENLIAVMQGQNPPRQYDGATACPIVTAYGKLIMAEFLYDHKWHPTIPLINTAKERYDMYLLKKYGLPFMYWHLMLRGLA